MGRKTALLLVAGVLTLVLAWPAIGAAPSQLARIKKLERQVRFLVIQGLQRDELRTSTVTGLITWRDTYGSGSAFCPSGSAATGGGVQWNGQFGADSGVYFSRPTGNGWEVGLRGGAGTTGFAQVVVVCTSLR